MASETQAESSETAQADPVAPPLATIARLPRGDDLARLVHAAAFSAASERRAALDGGLDELTQRFGIGEKDGVTPYGDVVRALRRDPAGTGPERAILGALLARGVAIDPPAEGGSERVAEALLWIAASTGIDPWPSIDEALGDKGAPLWRAVAEALEKTDGGTAKLSRAQSIIAAFALATSPAAAVGALRDRLVGSLRDPSLVRLLSTAGAVGTTSARPAIAAGELVSPPRGPVALVLLAMTGILPLVVVARVVGRFALRIRRPAELRVSASGVTVHARTEVLGRILRERELHIPTAALARAAREVRFPRLALYAGVAALVLGSYLGLRFFIDGVRAGSPELLAIGAALVVVGLVVDFLLSNVGATSRGRCRVLFVPRKGAAVAMADVDPALADAALHRLAPTTR
jgi:hypothetical protein